MECHRIAGSIPVNIPIEHASAFSEHEISELSERDPELNLEQRRDGDNNVVYRSDKPTVREFVLPKKNSEGRLGGIKDAVYSNKDIVITHSAFRLFDNEIISLLDERPDYYLIIDEIPEVIRPAKDLFEDEKLSGNDLQNLINIENVLHGDDDVLSWVETENSSKWDAFKQHEFLCRQNRLVLYHQGENPILLVRQSPEVFKAFNKVFILTYLFDGSICKSYFDLYGITYNVEHVERNFGDPIAYWSCINFRDSRDQTIRDFNNNNLSSSWYNENYRNLDFLQAALTNFFNNTVRGNTPEERMWTVVKGSNDRNKNALSGTGYSESFLPVNARATNLYSNVKTLAYLANIFLMPPLKNYFAMKSCPINQDTYALGELIQWVFRSQIRNGEPIDLFIPSPRMKELLRTWMEGLRIDNEGVDTE